MAKNFEFMVCGPQEFAPDELRQGDVLERNDVLRATIGEAHAYYADAPGYDYFLVLTPSCELVRRNGRCSSRYISIAAVRPAQLLIDRQLQNYKQSINAPGLFCASAKRQMAEQFLMRLIHNTEEGYLFLPGELFPGQGEDRAAFLRLSIALRASHYEACLQAKVVQLADSFSAKVGSLTADLYGQVATAAIEEQTDVNHEEIIARFKETMLDRDHIHWLSAQGIKALKKRLTSLRQQNPGHEITEEEARQLVAEIPNDQALLSDRIHDLLRQAGVTEEDAQLHRNAIASDSIVAQFLRGR